MNGLTIKRGGRKKRLRFTLFDGVVFALLSIFALSLLVVLFWGLVTSLTDGDAYEMEGIKYGLPFKYFTFDNYVNAFNNLKVTISSVNGDVNIYTPELLFYSLIYATGCAFFNTFVSCLVAYLTAKYPFRTSKIIYNVVLVIMIVPIVGELPSMVRLMTAVGLYDNLFGIYLMRASFTNMYFLVFFALFKGIPWSYGESAFLDGAGHFRVFWQIVLPLARSIFLTVFMLNFIVYWNEYQIPMLILPSMPTIAQAIYKFNLSFDSALAATPAKIAGSMLVCIPIMVLFAFFNKRLMGNLSVGGIKG